MTVGRDCFQRRPRSRRSSNEVAPSAGGGGGARDLRSRFSSSSPVRRVASVRKGEIPAELRTENFAEPFAMLCIAGLCGAAGHSNRGFAEPQGGGRKVEFSERAGQKTVGVSQGGEDPLAAFFAYFLSHHRK